ncbi:MAG: hypothetical protein A2087_13995 [Spirochaetes bacterium GWD1_61_31]|nr:MAG: hypothetical protein A2004_05720 [Spirochaetes bacterium GWC1_61_12]OHD42238.1 MAG: hypothetical protein A2087_13995 [Spirochaetes bacterium GWD1_61_31]OHD44027.1 MAG: hypothetical protein A2Y35_01680 [Spirochaetes bacterium GWE1_60_18]OHD59062.1 MAG: hypothetical protein A2Y32_02400 [Spirochaetes bacterium GWF1_60_12]HAP44019.1 FAD-dependent oxidoreductase [Spirochaetaceae bacterium]
MTQATQDNPAVAIIGGGGTGCALAWDLALRGCRVSLFEQGEFTSGTTGRHHGQLHCGARYAVRDRRIAAECLRESLTLRRIAPETIEYNGGFFVAVTDDEAAYGDVFISACLAAGIPARDLPPLEARRVEPGLTPSVRRAVWVPDGTFDTFRLPLSFLAAARRLGASLHPFASVSAIDLRAGRVAGLSWRRADGVERRAAFDCVINAAGAWADSVAALAGGRVPLTPAAGAMLAVRGRLSDLVISRLAPPGDGDIIVPQRGLSIIGSTQRRADSPDGLLPLPEELDFLLRRADELLPAFSAQPRQAAWAAVRPLAGLADGDGRAISRDLALIDHAAEGAAGLLSIVGGKATVLRAMAERAADQACRYLGLSGACRSANYRLPSWREFYQPLPAGSFTPAEPGLELAP